MPSTIERLPQARVRCIVTVTDDQRALAEERALKRLGSNIKLDGFREGRAPLNVVKEKVKPEMLLEETVRMMAGDVITDTMKEHDLKPVISPKLTVTKQNPLTLELIYVERPAVKLNKPDGIKVAKKPEAKVSAKEIDDFVNKVLSQDRTETPVDRAAAKGDLVRVQLQAINLDGSPMEELNNLPYSTTLGSEDLIPGLDAALVGAKAGEVKKIEPKFPKDHVIPTLRDKVIKIEAKVTGVAEVKLPELTQEFIKSRMGMDKSPAEFREGIEKALNEQNAFKVAKDREEEFFDLIRKATKVDIAPELLDTEVQNMLADLQENLSRENTSLDDWLKQSGKDPKQVLDEMREIAQSRITLRFGLQEYIKFKEVKIDDAELKKGIEQAKALAERDGRTVTDADMQPDGEIYAQAEWELQVRKVMAEAMGA
ncbi:MAG TPA: trigger factor [Candidatus Peribacteria bacterium]|nr:trigger factor [Candidatus Peribacteria bacterium]